MPVAHPRVLVSGRHRPATEELAALLTAGGFQVARHETGPSDPPDLSDCHVAIVESRDCADEALRQCRRWRPRPGDPFLPILFVAPESSPASRLAALDAGADTCLMRPFATEELLAQVRALLRIREVHDRLTERTAEVHRINNRLQEAYHQIDQELELARKLQVSFLPQNLPEVPPARFAVHYLLCGQVGGDFYDVFRLDENHVGFYVADAMGHGVPGSPLTIFVKKGLRAKEVFGHQYRLVPPAEVLARLNRDLIDQGLAETPFVTMVYALFNHRDGTLRFSRAGHPYPLHIPRSGELELWHGEGLLLGVFDAQFSDSAHRLLPGDKVLFYSDGVDNARFNGTSAGRESLLACAERYRDYPIQDLVRTLGREMFREEKPPDDLTLLGLEI